ncbi:MAG: ATP-binding cassette domain-containing protein [Candidatus Izemoplasmataceae bacterium]
MAIITARGIQKSFGKVQALKGIDLAIERGDIHGFIGPNGAGKTTMIRILLGILKADAGSATIYGQDVWDDAVQIHERIAYVPGDVNLWENLTGGEAIDILIGLKNGFKSNRKEALIERFQLDPTKKCRTYSKGNRQKIALIAAFSKDADLYILDEPTSGLDPLMEREFEALIREVTKEGKTVFLSSHILSEVEKLCDKVSIIREGKIIESGSLQELRHLTRTTISVETKRPVHDIGSLNGIHDLKQEATRYTFQVDDEAMGRTMRHLSDFEIVSLKSAPPTLEDLFMRHYEGV